MQTWLRRVLDGLEIRAQLLYWFLFSTKVVAGTNCFTGRNLKEETFILASVWEVHNASWYRGKDFGE